MNQHFLRIGNIVSRKFWNPQPENEHFAYQSCIICALKENNCLVKHSPADKSRLKQPYDTIFGVKISDFHLKEFGFEVSETPEGFTSWKKGNFILIDKELPYQNHYKPVEFVHELQNIYLDLMGELLTFSIK